MCMFEHVQLCEGLIPVCEVKLGRSDYQVFAAIISDEQEKECDRWKWKVELWNPKGQMEMELEMELELDGMCEERAMESVIVMGWKLYMEALVRTSR